MVFDAIVNDDRVVPGQMLRWTLSSWNASDEPRTAAMRAAECIPLAECHSPDREPAARAIQPGQVATDTVDYPVLDQPPSTPYFLRLPRDGDLYRWPEERSDQTGITGGLPYGEPFESPTFLGSVEVNAGASDSLGASRLDRSGLPLQRPGPRRGAPAGDGGAQDRREARSGHRAVAHQFAHPSPLHRHPDPRCPGHDLGHGGPSAAAGLAGRQVAGIPLYPRGRAGNLRVRRETACQARRRARPRFARWRGIRQGRRMASAYSRWTIPTSGRGRIPSRPVPRIRMAPLVLPKLARVGYIRGAADQVPEALASVGVPVVLLTAATLERGNLARFDAIVVGPRAYETDSALVANNRRLLEYARRGGLVIVQYQQHRFFTGRFAPIRSPWGATAPAG